VVQGERLCLSSPSSRQMSLRSVRWCAVGSTRRPQLNVTRSRFRERQCRCWIRRHGPDCRAHCADAVYKHCNGDVAAFFSVGFAGALSLKLRVGDVVEPKNIVCAADDTEIINSTGTGTLISAGAVAGVDAKATMAKRFGGDAVDMEAYSVADVARIYGIPFRAVKVISDEFDFPMPPMGRFIDDRGRFRRGRFIIYSAMRPWLWGKVLQLARSSSRAARVLCSRLQQEMAIAKSPEPSRQPTEVAR